MADPAFGWRGLLRRLRRLWGQDRIRLSAADLPPAGPAPGDRLQVDNRSFRLLRRGPDVDGAPTFTAVDEARQRPLVIRFTGTTYRFEPVDSEPVELPSASVLLYRVEDRPGP